MARQYTLEDVFGYSPAELDAYLATENWQCTTLEDKRRATLMILDADGLLTLESSALVRHPQFAETMHYSPDAATFMRLLYPGPATLPRVLVQPLPAVGATVVVTFPAHDGNPSTADEGTVIGTKRHEQDGTHWVRTSAIYSDGPAACIAENGAVYLFNRHTMGANLFPGATWRLE